MTSSTLLNHLRQQILQNPNAILNDQEVIRALISADDAAMGHNVVDLKTIVVNRLEGRLSQLEGHHKTVLSAAYQNISSTNHLHRAILAALEPNSFTEFLAFLSDGLADTLNVSVAKICMETSKINSKTVQELSVEFGKGIVFLKAGEINHYITLNNKTPSRAVTLRQIQHGISSIHDEHADHIRSEALIKIDLGIEGSVGLLALASRDETKFTPDMGADLLIFFGAVFERIVQRWIAHD